MSEQQEWIVAWFAAGGIVLSIYGIIRIVCWIIKKMMKEAVEGTVHNFSSNKPHPTVLVDANGFNQGDKVRIIIVKEDER